MAPPKKPEQQSKQQTVQGLRQFAKLSIEAAIEHQENHWKDLEIQIHGAKAEVDGRHMILLWAKIEELANANTYPLWMDAVLTVATAFLPVSSILGALGARLALSKRLRALPDLKDVQRAIRGRKKEIFPLTPTTIKGILSGRAAQVISPGSHTGVQAVLDARAAERWIKLGSIYKPEIENMAQGIITLVLKSKVEPLYNREVLVKKPGEADSTGLPSATIYTGFLHWIETSRRIDKAILKALYVVVELIDDEDILRKIPAFVLEEDIGVVGPSDSFVKAPFEFFQRFVESCLWCTTFDFAPTYIPPSLVHSDPGPYGFASVSPGKNSLFPFPDNIWDYLISRHYDPFMGYQKYSDIPIHSYLAPPSVLPSTNAVYDHDRSQPREGYDSKTRLSVHWGQILAPQLLMANKEIARVLETFLPR